MNGGKNSVGAGADRAHVSMHGTCWVMWVHGTCWVMWVHDTSHTKTRGMSGRCGSVECWHRSGGCLSQPGLLGDWMLQVGCMATQGGSYLYRWDVSWTDLASAT